MKNWKRLFCILAVSMLLLMGMLVGCKKSPEATVDNDKSETTTTDEKEATEEITEEKLPLLEYTIDLEYTAPATTLDNPNDIVTPYIEEKFNIKVKEITQGSTQQIPFKERLAAMIAADNLPDVIAAAKANIDYAVSTGKYGGGLQEYIEKMDNMNKYMDPIFWPRFMNNGFKTQIPVVTPDTTKSEYTSDPYNIPLTAWCLWTREDVLEKAGYSFKPLAEIEEEYISKGLVPPESEFAITPAIDTPEKFYEYLEKIKELDIMVNDKPLIPFSGVNWNQFHLGSMFDFGHWRIDSAGVVDGFLGSSGAKEYYRWLNVAYQEELIDPDFISQKDDQLQQKIATGRVAVGMYAPDMKGAMNALVDADPNAVIRYISWPKEDVSLGKFDIFENGFWRVTISSDFQEKERLTQYFDWFFSDEGLDILTWGPEEAGLWKMEDGKKVFVDEEVEQACLNGDTGKKGADYYGLYDWKGNYYQYISKAAICAPTLHGYNPKSFTRSYPAKLEVDVINQAYFGITGQDFSGRYAYGDGSAEVSLISDWYWSKWVSEKCAKVLVAQTEEEFNEEWEKAYAQFVEETSYDIAKVLMTDWFEENTN